jgi:single-strand DNA-binding protein
MLSNSKHLKTESGLRGAAPLPHQTFLHVEQLKITTMTTLRNRVQLVGNLGMNPEIVNFESGKKIAKFTVATNETYTGANGKSTTNTQWHNVVAWGKQAEIVEKHLNKGKEVALEGRLTYRQYEDKNKQTRHITEIVLNSFIVTPGA